MDKPFLTSTPLSTPLESPIADSDPDLRAEADRILSRANTKLAELSDQIKAEVTADLRRIATDVDSVRQPIIDAVDGAIFDCTQTLNIVCNRLRNGADSQLEKVWNQVRAIGVDLPDLAGFLSGSDGEAEGKVLPSVSYPSVGGIPNEIPLDGKRPPVLYPPVDYNNPNVLPTTPPHIPPPPLPPELPKPYPAPIPGPTPQPGPNNNCCPPGTTYTPEDGGWCISNYGGSKTRPAGWPNECGTIPPPPKPQPGPIPVPEPGPGPEPQPEPEPCPKPEPCPAPEPCPVPQPTPAPTCPVPSTDPCEVQETRPEEVVCSVDLDDEPLGTVWDENGQTRKVAGAEVAAVDNKEDHADYIKRLHILGKAGCDTLTQLRQLYINFGRCLVQTKQRTAKNVQAYRLSLTVLRELTATLWGYKESAFGTFWARYEATFLDGHTSWFFTDYLAPLRQADKKRFDTALYLGAAVLALEAMRNYSLSGNRTAGHNWGEGDSGGVNLGGTIPMIGSIGGGWNSNRGEGQGTAMSYGGGFAVMLVPLIEIGRWFQTNADSQQIPSVSEIRGAYLRGGYSRETYDCLLSLWSADNGTHEGLLWADRSQLNASDYQSAKMRGLLTKEEADQAITHTGVIDPRDRELIDKLSIVPPGPSDIVRFMTRDVEDEDIVKTFDLDADFEKKFRGPTEEYAKWQGVSRELMLRYWRAHWRTIGIGQAYEALHRQRQFDEQGKPNPLYTSIEHVRTLLQQDDTPKFWVDRLIADSYAILTRVDIRRLRNLGIIDSGIVVSKNQDRGYTEADAERLAKFTERDRFNSLKALPATKSYLADLIPKAEFDAAMEEVNIEPSEKDRLLAWINNRRRETTKKICMAATKRQYVTGGIPASVLPVRLQGLGLDADQVERVQRRWDCERDARERTIAASQLCEWYTHGLVTREEFGYRLISVGYAPQDANRIILRCEGNAAEKAQRAAQQQAKAQEAAKEKAERKLAAEQKRTQAAIEKAEKLREKLAEKRRKQLEKLRKAAEKMSEHSGRSISDSAADLDNQIDRLMRDYHYTQSDAESIVIDSANVWGDSGVEDFAELVDEVREAGEEIEDTEQESSEESGEKS